METGLYVALSSQVALEKRLDTIADNMANAGTVGFRSTGVKFEDLVKGTGEDSVAFASAGESYLPDRSGPLRQTDNPFDFAVQGDGWFAIQTPAGQVVTRDGRFTLKDNGDLVTIEGYQVLDAGGAPIQLDPRGGPPEASDDGTLRQNGRIAGSIGLFDFTPGTGFQRYGNSGLLVNGALQPLVDRTDSGVVQGFVEESNVNPVHEMMQLIQVQRAFENITALMRDNEGSLQDAIKTLGSS